MNSKLIKFDYTHLRNEAHVAYHESVKILFGTYTPASLNITPQYNAFHAAYTEEISVLDIIHFNPAKREVILKVENVIAHHGNMATKTLERETGMRTANKKSVTI